MTYHILNTDGIHHKYGPKTPAGYTALALADQNIRDLLAALDEAMARIRAFAPELLLLSFGADTFSGDPISFFRLETKDYPLIGRRIADAGLPTLVVMEGGYAVGDLGSNVAAFLSGF